MKYSLKIGKELINFELFPEDNGYRIETEEKNLKVNL